MRIRHWISLSVTLLSVSGVQAADAGATVTQAEALVIVAHFEEAYAAAYGHPDAMAALLAKGVVVFTNRGVLRQGREEELASERKAAPGASRIRQGKTLSVQVLGSGRVILTQGEGERFQLAGGNDHEDPHPPSEKYLYTKGLVFEDGTWKLVFAQFSPVSKPASAP